VRDHGPKSSEDSSVAYWGRKEATDLSQAPLYLCARIPQVHGLWATAHRSPVLLSAALGQQVDLWKEHSWSACHVSHGKFAPN
jgi:hypothetical protein